MKINQLKILILEHIFFNSNNFAKKLKAIGMKEGYSLVRVPAFNRINMVYPDARTPGRPSTNKSTKKYIYFF